MRILERLIARTGCARNSEKRSIIEDDLNLPRVDRNGDAEGNNPTETVVNRLVWDNGYSQVVDSPTRRYAILEVYLVRPDSLVTSSGRVQGISDHHGVMLEVDSEENCTVPQPERLIPVYYKTDVVGLQTFLTDRFSVLANNGSRVQQIWNNFESIIHESVEHFVPHKFLKTNSDPEYYNKDIKLLKSKVRKAYNRRNLGTHHMDRLKQLSKQLLSAKKQAQGTYLKSILCWSDLYKYVKRRKGSRESIPAIMGRKGRVITDPTGKANELNYYYSTIFSSEDSVQHIQGINSANPFTIDIKTIRKRVTAIGRNKSVGPDSIPA